MAYKKARVLVTTTIGGLVFRPNCVIQGDADKIQSLKHSLDMSPEGLKYCLDELKEKVIDVNDLFPKSDKKEPQKLKQGK